MNNPVHHNVKQGESDWHALRDTHFTASESSAMMGDSEYTTRTDLLNRKASGVAEAIDAATAARFRAGHEAEAAARPIAERIVGEELYPATVTLQYEELPLLASCDGLTLLGEIAWEHKLWNESDAVSVRQGIVPRKHIWQLEQQLLVTGAVRTLFMLSDGTEDRCVYCWYEPQPGLFEKLIAGWRQFAVDLADYEPTVIVEPPMPATPDDLPLLELDIVGSVRDTNLGTWQQVVAARIAGINTDLQTDQDFADAEGMVKFLKVGEQDIVKAKAAAIAQTKSIDELFQAVDRLKDQMREKRLELEKLVKARKNEIRFEIAAAALGQVMAHAANIAEGFDRRLRAPDVLESKFRQDCIEAMKGKRNVAALHDAASATATQWKLDLTAKAQLMTINIRHFDDLIEDEAQAMLFPDVGSLVHKDLQDFEATVKARIADAKAAEQAKREAAEKAEAARREQEAATAAAQANAKPATAETSPTVSAPANDPAPAPETVETPTYPAPSEPEDAGDLSAGEIALDVADVGVRLGESGIEVAIREGNGDLIVVPLTIEQATQVRDQLTRKIREERKAQEAA